MSKKFLNPKLCFHSNLHSLWEKRNYTNCLWAGQFVYWKTESNCAMDNTSHISPKTFIKCVCETREPWCRIIFFFLSAAASSFFEISCSSISTCSGLSLGWRTIIYTEEGLVPGNPLEKQRESIGGSRKSIKFTGLQNSKVKGYQKGRKEIYARKILLHLLQFKTRRSFMSRK